MTKAKLVKTTRAKVKRPDNTPDFIIRENGICSAIVCTAITDRREIERRANSESPTGISSRWRISRRRKLDDGTKLPAPCLDHKERRHWLLEC